MTFAHAVVDYVSTTIIPFVVEYLRIIGRGMSAILADGSVRHRLFLGVVFLVCSLLFLVICLFCKFRWARKVVDTGALLLIAVLL